MDAQSRYVLGGFAEWVLRLGFRVPVFQEVFANWATKKTLVGWVI